MTEDRPWTAGSVQLSDEVSRALTEFTGWLTRYGEMSHDHQTFFAGATGQAAKALYYRHKLLGTAAVAPMIFCEAFVPSARRFFHRPTRFPIADAHYAMGFAFLFQVTSDHAHLRRAIHFLEELKKSRSPGFGEYCWGYPYDWVTRNGKIKEQTPLITSTPYAYEGFLHVHELDGREEWKDVMASIARHAFKDIKDFSISENASSCSYTPFDKGGVINAAAYRSFLLTSASQIFSRKEYWLTAERNLNFVLEAQNLDGSWFYAVDGVRDFVDHSLRGLGFSISGRNCVHASTLGTDLLGEPFAVVRQGGLCGCVRQCGFKERERSLDGRDMDNHTRALFQHRWKKSAIQSDGGEQVRVRHRVEDRHPSADAGQDLFSSTSAALSLASR